MREFITQDELTEEFIEFLKKRKDWENYIRELSYSYDFMKDTIMYSEKHPITLLGDYLEIGNIEEYLHRIASKEPIIDVRIPSLSVRPLDYEPTLSSMEHDFVVYINEKYTDKIKSVCIENKSLLIRWMKEKNTLGTFNNEYGGKEMIIENINPYLESNIPHMIFPRIKSSKQTSKFKLLRERFRIFYTRIVTDEKS